MSGLFGKKFGKGSSGATSPPGTNPSKSKNKTVEEPEPEITPLVKMLQNAGPIRPDGSDKFLGMENFGNTCYCNSIVQALYFSVPFREHVVTYPPQSPFDTPNGHQPKFNVSIRAQNGGAVQPAAKPKGISAAEALKRRAAINAGQPPAPGQPQKPEDKPDSPEYKKKHAMLAGPILDLTYENANTYGMDESTFTALKDIFMAVITSQSRIGVLSPQRFLEIFKRDNEMFRTSMHQDAHEFYGLVLNAIITNVEANSQRMKELEPPRSDDGLALSMKAAVTSAAANMGLMSGSRSPGTGWVHDIFEGVLTSETRCLTCENASQRDETFLDLSIDLEQHSSVTSCLGKFSAEEMLCERNKFHCDNCGGLQEAEKRMKIKRLPKILALHLKRFKYTEDMTRLQKLFHRVVYPYYLRMFNTTDDAEDPDRLYELYAVVVHIGGNAYHGHYVSVIKTQDRGWLLFDDEMVEPVDKHYVRNFFGEKPGMACAYLLFYQETTSEAMRKEQEAEGLAEVALASKEAGMALGHPQPDDINPASISKQVSIPSTPVEDREQFASLSHIASAPLPSTSTRGVITTPQPPLAVLTQSVPPSPAVVLNAIKSPITKPTSKEEREREKAEKKEAEKARKIAEKEKVKADEKRRKELEENRKQLQRAQAEEVRKAMELSKQSAREDEERRRKEAAAAASASTVSASTSSTSGPPPTSPALVENGNGNGSNTVQNNRVTGSTSSGLSSVKDTLTRGQKGSKSTTRKSFGLLSKGKSGSEAGDTAVDGEAGPQTPEKHEKLKDRFSFSGLGRKKSNLMSQ